VADPGNNYYRININNIQLKKDKNGGRILKSSVCELSFETFLFQWTSQFFGSSHRLLWPISSCLISPQCIMRYRFLKEFQPLFYSIGTLQEIWKIIIWVEVVCHSKTTTHWKRTKKTTKMEAFLYSRYFAGALFMSSDKTHKGTEENRTAHALNLKQ
jgi:hypothetical protein